jgi:hypothetical protein
LALFFVEPFVYLADLARPLDALAVFHAEDFLQRPVEVVGNVCNLFVKPLLRVGGGRSPPAPERTKVGCLFVLRAIYAKGAATATSSSISSGVNSSPQLGQRTIPSDATSSFFVR